MTRPRLSHEARRLLEADLDSIEKLEILRYLQQAETPVSQAELVSALQLGHEAAAALIAGLARADLVIAGGDREDLRPGARAGSAPCRELLQVYAEDRLTIVSLLSTIAVDRIRSMAMRAFGEALVSKKKPNDDDGKP